MIDRVKTHGRLIIWTRTYSKNFPPIHSIYYPLFPEKPNTGQFFVSEKTDQMQWKVRWINKGNRNEGPTMIKGTKSKRFWAGNVSRITRTEATASLELFQYKFGVPTSWTGIHHHQFNQVPYSSHTWPKRRNIRPQWQISKRFLQTSSPNSYPSRRWRHIENRKRAEGTFPMEIL